MNYWRVTKYNPKYRDENNRYSNDEWTSICEVGEYFNNTEFTFSTYLEQEEKYIHAVISAMRELGIDQLKIEELEHKDYNQYSDLTELNAKEFYHSIKCGTLISIDEVPMLMKLILREMMWAKLESEYLFIHFGYDYYMYWGSRRELNKTKETIQQLGLFIEDFHSPYLD